MPLPREELEEMIRAGIAEADDEVVAAWQRMRIEPELWRCRGEHVWVIAMRDGAAVWYDEVEEGFLAVPFAERGVIDPQWTSQDDFADFLRKLPEGRA